MAFKKVKECFQGVFDQRFRGLVALGVFSFVFSLSYTHSVFAQEVNDIADNIVSSSEKLPGLVAAVAYGLGLLFGVLGVLKLKGHVENPTQTALKSGIIRLLIGGAMFSLPIVYEAARNTIGKSSLDVDVNTFITRISGIFSTVSGIPIISSLVNDFNVILSSIISSMDEVPGLISALAYIIGLVIGIVGLVKLKDHVENPEQVTLKEPVVRLLVAGALFALPSIYNSMLNAIGDSAGTGGLLSSIAGFYHFVSSGYTPGTELECLDLSESGVGQLLCGTILHTAAFPAFLTALSYLFGLILGLWGIFKLRDHVLNPSQTAVSEGISRFLAGGAFFALPIIIETARVTLSGASTGSVGAAVAAVFAVNNALTTKGYNQPVSCGPTSGGLDGILVCAMGDVMGPLHVVLNFFAFCAGVIFLMIGISRLIKSAQEGARGPGGIGTIMTFVTGGALISYNELMRAFTTTFTGSSSTKAHLKLSYNICGGGADATCAESDAAHAALTSVLQFVIIVGLISFVRGIFIVRGVAEGNQQASVMAGVTHLVGGALAVNLGPILNAVQTTLGLVGYGIKFT